MSRNLAMVAKWLGEMSTDAGVAAPSHPAKQRAFYRFLRQLKQCGIAVRKCRVRSVGGVWRQSPACEETSMLRFWLDCTYAEARRLLPVRLAIPIGDIAPDSVTAERLRSYGFNIGRKGKR